MGAKIRMRKETKILVLAPACAVLLVISCYFSLAIWSNWLFQGKIVVGLYVVQRPFKGVFDIRHDSVTLVPQVEGWIVCREYVYGSAHGDTYFVIDRNSFTAKLYVNPNEFFDFLETEHLPFYEMSDEEGVIDLKGRLGRNRKYGDR